MDGAQGVKIGGPFDIGGPGGWWILDEPEIHLDSHILVPDLAGWKRERMPQIPDEAFFTLIPDWVCEVLSPSTRRLDKSKKMPLYAQQGLRYLWLVDPVDKTLEVYENQSGKWFLHQVYSDNDIAQAAPFDSLKIDLSALWS